MTHEDSGHKTLPEFKLPKCVYAIGRLDWDSDGLLLLFGAQPLPIRDRKMVFDELGGIELTEGSGREG